MLRLSAGSARLAVPAGTLLALCLTLALATGAGAADRRHVPAFDLLVRPTPVAKLPLTLRIGFEGFGKHPHKHGRTARIGQAHLADGTLTAAGNHRWICTNFSAKGEPNFAGNGGCSPYAQVVREGLVSICGDEDGKLRIDGLLPNGIVAVEFDRPGPGPTLTVPVTRNAFATPLPHAELSFRALDAGGEAVIEHRYPLANARGAGCYAFFEARSEAGRGGAPRY